jgi:citrate synthase
MNIQIPKSPIGLDGIAAAETVLSHVDGERGELIIAGERVGDLVRKTGFEGVTARLWSGGTGQQISEAEVRAALGAARERAFNRLPDLLGITRGLPIVDGFRAAIAGLRAESGLSHEATIVGAFPVIAGALLQRASGRDPIAPDPTVSHAADTLSMILNRKPDAREVAALDAYFVTVCDHGMNASTFTTRVVASTQADLFAAVTAGYCALTGPLHGGAPEPVLEMLDAIGTSDRIKPWVDSALARGERLMGFGHRIYRVRDPRADVLKGRHRAARRWRYRSSVRKRGRGLYPRGVAAGKTGPSARHQCGVLHRDLARHPDNPAASLYADFRGCPRRRMDSTRPRATAGRPADTAKFSLYRPDAGLRPCRRGDRTNQGDTHLQRVMPANADLSAVIPGRAPAPTRNLAPIISGFRVCAQKRASRNDVPLIYRPSPGRRLEPQVAPRTTVLR